MRPSSRNMTVCQAENGLPTATFRFPEGREIYLHSRFDPEAEARFLVESIPVKEKTLYVVLGFGLGYHVKALLNRIPASSHILVIEPATEHLSLQAADCLKVQNGSWLQDDRLSFHSHYDPETVPIFLADAFIRLRAMSLNIYMHIPSASTNEAFYCWLLKEIQQQFPVYLEGQMGANDRTLENNLTNYWFNLPFTWQTPHISNLRGGWRGRPIVIVAAGPSLSEELDQLRRIQERIPIICVGTAAPILMSSGVTPHFVVSLDPLEANMKHFEDWDNRKVPLIFYHRIWRGIMPMYNGPKYWFTMDDEPAIPLTGINPTAEFWRGGTVSFTALQVAHYLKADPIILVGLDLAYLDGHRHAGDSADETINQNGSAVLPEGHFRIPSISGEQVVTNLNYYSYLLYIQDYIQRHPQIQHINTSRSGAKIHGTIEMPLKKLLEDIDTSKRIDQKQFLSKKKLSFEPVPHKSMIDLIQKRERELSGFIDATRTIAKLDELLTHFRRLSMYHEISDAYDHCFHTWAIKKLKHQSESEETLCERLKAHCRCVQNRFQELLTDETVSDCVN